MPLDVGVVVVAAGRGLRLGGVPKQFRDLSGVPVLRSALEPFLSHPDVIFTVAVLPQDMAESPPDWLAEGGARYVALPASVPDGDVAAWIRRSCAWILVNEGLLRHRPAALAPLARWDERGGVVLAPDRPAWAAEVAACDAGTPSRWCLVRVDP